MEKSSDLEQALKIEIQRVFKFSAEQVFDAWLDVDAVANWFFASPAGELKRVELDPRVGGKFVISELRGDVLAEHFGEYLHIERPVKLVFAYTMDLKEALTEVTVDIKQLEEGCELSLSHDLDPKWAHMIDLAQQGWSTILEGLDKQLRSETEISSGK